MTLGKMSFFFLSNMPVFLCDKCVACGACVSCLVAMLWGTVITVIHHGEHIVAALQRWYGQASTGQLVENIGIPFGCQPGTDDDAWPNIHVRFGSQPDTDDDARPTMHVWFGSQPGTEDDGLGAGRAHTGLQLNVWRRHIVSELGQSYSVCKKMRLKRSLAAYARWSTESSLPKLFGTSGALWLQKWQLRHGVHKQAMSRKLKTARNRMRGRILFLLANMFRLRHFAQMLSPSFDQTPVMFDQTPVWLNTEDIGTNARFIERAHTFARIIVSVSVGHRYTLLTGPPLPPREPALALMDNR